MTTENTQTYGEALDYITECQIAMRLKEDPSAPRCLDCGAPVSFDRSDPEDGVDVWRCPRCGPVVEVDFEPEAAIAALPQRMSPKQEIAAINAQTKRIRAIRQEIETMKEIA